MIRFSLGLIIGIGLSVVYYEYEISPTKVVEVTYKNAHILIEEIKETVSEGS